MVQQYSLSWNSYKTNLSTGFSSLQQNGEFVDMTLAADGYFVKVHQALVALSSPYLKSIITSAPCQHPIVFLNKISHKTLTKLLEYIYTGEVVVPTEDMTEFTEAARCLCIKGFEKPSQNNIITINGDIKSTIEAQEQTVLPLTVEEIAVKQKNDPVEATVLSKSEASILHKDDNSHDYAEPMDDTGGYDTDGCIKCTKPVGHQNTPDTSDVGELSSTLQYSVSIRGAIQIILNRYIYNLSCTKKKGIRRWRCVNYRANKCLAFVVTKDNIVLNRSNPHNHSFHDKKILDKLKMKKVFSVIDDVKFYAPKDVEVRIKNNDSLEYDKVMSD